MVPDVPRYFFTTDDGTALVEDLEGIELSDGEVARRCAQTALADMVRDTLPDGDERRFSVEVRDERGRTFYSARLILSGEWHGGAD